MTSSNTSGFSEAELDSLSVWSFPDVPSGKIKPADIFEPVSPESVVSSKASRFLDAGLESLAEAHLSDMSSENSIRPHVFESVSGSSIKTAGFSDIELESLSVWRMPNIPSGNRATSTIFESVPLSILTVDDIELMQKQAYDEAFAQGKEEGYSEGRSQGLSNGFDEGFKDGLNKGSAQGYEENLHILQAKAAEFNLILEALGEPFKNLDTEVEQELIKIVIAIATQVIYREIKLDPELILAVVRVAIKALPLSAQKINLHLHPEDADLVRSAFELDEPSAIWLAIEDPSISRGGCMVDTDISHIDVTVEKRVAVVIATLLDGEQEQDSSS